MTNRMQLTQKINKLIMTKGKDTIMLSTVVQTMQKTHAELFDAELLLIEADSDLETLQARSGSVQTQIDQRRKEVEETRAAQALAKRDAEAIASRVTEIDEALSDEERQIHDQQPERQTMQELEDQIESRQARFEMVHEGNPNALREFEERARKIESIKAKLDKISSDLGGTEGQIQSIRQEWEPQLDTLIGKISAAFADNFERIGCAGQVDVFKVDDFADWSIQIRVKFR